jgi:hypothetical protein
VRRHDDRRQQHPSGHSDAYGYVYAYIRTDGNSNAYSYNHAKCYRDTVRSHGSDFHRREDYDGADDLAERGVCDGGER